jgi:hypothetical protein
MDPAHLKFAIPDLELGCEAGLKVNPSSFAGHELIVLFCPTGRESAAKEIGDYRSRADEFVKHDAWLLTFADDGQALEESRGKLLIIPDANRRAWAAFRNLTGRADEFDRSNGATFLFTRGGNLHRYWHGPGHLHEVLEELARPSFEHAHQWQANGERKRSQ